MPSIEESGMLQESQKTMPYAGVLAFKKWRTKEPARALLLKAGQMSFSWSTTSPDRSSSQQGGKRTKISHNSNPVVTVPITSWDINDSLAADFDGSLSGLGTELGTSSYNMSEALLALPVFKQENLDNGFQYILGAATSPAIKMNEETLTYLNQGQSYEIKLKKLGDLSNFHDKYLRSVVKICFHERRLQYMEKEQIDSWRQIRPGERILEIDIPLSYGLLDVKMESSRLSESEFIWDPRHDAGVYIKVHCISTEFTAKKHGGEKGVPFRVQVETYSHGDEESKLLHCASCQVKVFKPKGADRKHKTDREKMEKRSDPEKEKFQPSYECTVLTEVPVEQVVSTLNTNFGAKSQVTFGNLTQSFAELNARSPTGVVASPSATVSKSNSDDSVILDMNHDSLTVSPSLNNSNSNCNSLAGQTLLAEANANAVKTWLQANRFSNYVRVFQNFSGADILRLSREDLIQICGLADGIRLNNALQSRNVRPRLTIFVCQESDSVYHALYLETLTNIELTSKLARLYSVGSQQIMELYCQGPSGIYILVTDEVVRNLQDQSRFCVEAMKSGSTDHYKVVLKSLP